MIEKLQKYKKFWLIGVLALCAIFIWIGAAQASEPGELTVSFLDVGQGDSIFIQAPNGRQLLIDGGANASVLSGLGQVMGFFDRSIDVVLATHPDKDHIGGLPFVFERYRVDQYVDSLADGEAGAYRKLLDLVEEEGSETTYGIRGMVIELDPEASVYFHILYPMPDEFAIDETNELSIIGKLVYGDTSFMLTGDAGKVPELLMTSTDGAYLKSSVLKAGHHGSDTSSAPSFVRAVDPKWAIISAGADNSYGHPHPSVIRTLESAGAEILETAEEGMITFVSNGIDVWREGNKNSNK